MYVFVCQMGEGQKQKRKCHEWFSFVCAVRFYGSHENTRHERTYTDTLGYAVELSIRLHIEWCSIIIVLWAREGRSCEPIVWQQGVSKHKTQSVHTHNST